MDRLPRQVDPFRRRYSRHTEFLIIVSAAILLLCGFAMILHYASSGDNLGLFFGVFNTVVASFLLILHIQVLRAITRRPR
jgi:hypothetical protein